MPLPAAPIPRELRWHVRKHNLWVFFLGILCLLAALWMWGALYLVMHWIGLLLLTSLHGLDAPRDPDFARPFLVVAAALLTAAGIARGFSSGRRPPLGSFRWSKVLLDILLLPGRLTLAGPDTFRAWVRVSESELEAAWELLQRLHTAEKLSFQELSTVVPKVRELENALYLLGITNLTEVDEYAGTWYLHFRSDATRAVVRKLVHPQL